MNFKTVNFANGTLFNYTVYEYLNNSGMDVVQQGLTMKGTCMNGS